MDKNRNKNLYSFSLLRLAIMITTGVRAHRQLIFNSRINGTALPLTNERREEYHVSITICGNR